MQCGGDILKQHDTSDSRQAKTVMLEHMEGREGAWKLCSGEDDFGDQSHPYGVYHSQRALCGEERGKDLWLDYHARDARSQSSILRNRRSRNGSVPKQDGETRCRSAQEIVTMPWMPAAKTTYSEEQEEPERFSSKAGWGDQVSVQGLVSTEIKTRLGSRRREWVDDVERGSGLGARSTHPEI